jgi:hypothetical protein
VQIRRLSADVNVGHWAGWDDFNQKIIRRKDNSDKRMKRLNDDEDD